MENNTKNDIGSGVGFERIRRITGYLVGSMEKWNDSKKAEEHDRINHGMDPSALHHPEK